MIAIDIIVIIAKMSTLQTPVKRNSLSFVPVNKRYLRVCYEHFQLDSNAILLLQRMQIDHVKKKQKKKHKNQHNGNTSSERVST